MVRVDDIETARTAEGGCAVVGARRCGDSGWERLGNWPWHELDYAAVVEDSDRILADALTPAAWVLLARLAAGILEPAARVPPIVVPCSSYQVPVMRPRATQRSPPQ
ncbi:hypothetical protein ACHMZP_33400 [Rhodococcus baikonurensis]|uniref:hypothetical protein n=1 Tax=Rhodococcus baikonurensis TaxID=172041 RepID=UPI0037932FAB